MCVDMQERSGRGRSILLFNKQACGHDKRVMDASPLMYIHVHICLCTYTHTNRATFPSHIDTHRHVAQLCWHMLCLGPTCRSALFVSASATKASEVTCTRVCTRTSIFYTLFSRRHTVHTALSLIHTHFSHTQSNQPQGVVLLRLRRDEAYINHMLRWLHLFVNRYLGAGGGEVRGSVAVCMSLCMRGG